MRDALRFRHRPLNCFRFANDPRTRTISPLPVRTTMFSYSDTVERRPRTCATYCICWPGGAGSVPTVPAGATTFCSFTTALTSSAEVLLMVIAGGPATLLGPIFGAALVVVVKNVVSGYIERWNFLLGAIFVAIVILMPEGLVPGTVRLWRQGFRAFRRRRGVILAQSAEPRG